MNSTQLTLSLWPGRVVSTPRDVLSYVNEMCVSKCWMLWLWIRGKRSVCLQVDCKRRQGNGQHMPLFHSIPKLLPGWSCCSQCWCTLTWQLPYFGEFRSAEARVKKVTKNVAGTVVTVQLITKDSILWMSTSFHFKSNVLRRHITVIVALEVKGTGEPNWHLRAEILRKNNWLGGFGDLFIDLGISTSGLYRP